MPTIEENWQKLLAIIGNPSTCGAGERPGCGKEIFWITTKFGKAMPLNRDASPHWATCPNARNFKRS